MIGESYWGSNNSPKQNNFNSSSYLQNTWTQYLGNEKKNCKQTIISQTKPQSNPIQSIMCVLLGGYALKIERIHSLKDLPLEVHLGVFGEARSGRQTCISVGVKVGKWAAGVA